MGLWNWIKENAATVIGTAVGIALAPATGGTSMLLCGGAGFLIGSSIDNDRKKRETENQQLALKGEVSKEIREEINNLQDERTQKAGEANTIDQQIAQKKNKLNDPSISEKEKTQIRSEIAALMSQKGSVEQQIKGLDDKINNLLKSAQQTVTGGSGLANLEMDYQTKMIIIGIVFLIIYFLLIKDNK